MKKLWISLIIAPIISMMMVAAHVTYLYKSPYSGKNVIFKIHPGEGFSSINYRLTKDGLVSNPRIFHYLTKFTEKLNAFKTGSYEITTGMTMQEVLELLTSGGKAILNSVTIPEGKNLFEIAKILEANKITDKAEFIKWSKNSEFMKELGIPAERVEGYLYPNTYRFSKDSPAKLIIKSMVNQFKKATTKIDLSETSLTPHEVVTLASIVEKETGAFHERPIIAGVFHNRLKKRMRLQSDPTTIYWIYENFNGNLRKKHLQEKTPYNTYRIGGLPKGPISNPGLDSIMAVLEPTQHDYLYFVSHNDGTHAFSKTYKEHRAAVQKYQINRRARRGKSWRDLKQRRRQRKLQSSN